MVHLSFPGTRFRVVAGYDWRNYHHDLDDASNFFDGYKHLCTISSHTFGDLVKRGSWLSSGTTSVKKKPIFSLSVWFWVILLNESNRVLSGSEQLMEYKVDCQSSNFPFGQSKQWKSVDLCQDSPVSGEERASVRGWLIVSRNHHSKFEIQYEFQGGESF